MNELLWLFLLLPVAAAGGWMLARRRGAVREGERTARFSGHYFRGLNYLLNEQPDKAIEVFLRLAEVNQETVETHLALGNLFRRRGEVDKAIRFHKHIISRPELTEEQRTQALLELGEDYMRAGLLDRAEKLFSELVDHDQHSDSATRHLLSVYQQEKDWEKAIEQALRLGRVTGESTVAMVAQFYCELAEEARVAGDDEGVMKGIRQARRYRPECARAHIIEARLAASRNRLEDAIEAYVAACELDPGCFPLVVDSLIECCERAERLESAREWLEQVVAEYDGITPALALARLMGQSGRQSEAARFMLGYLERRPSVRGLEYIVELMIERGAEEVGMDPEMLAEMVRRLLEGQPRFRCQHCGFSGQNHHWQCPSCRRWETTRPVAGVMGE